MEDTITIVGAGISGLATAMLLSPKHKVIIIARDQPGDLGTQWASPWYAISSAPLVAAQSYSE